MVKNIQELVQMAEEKEMNLKKQNIYVSNNKRNERPQDMSEKQWE